MLRRSPGSPNARIVRLHAGSDGGSEDGSRRVTVRAMVEIRRTPPFPATAARVHRGSVARAAFLAVLGLLVASSIGGCGEREGARARPNLLLVTLDTVRADHLGCYGYERPTSPQLDRFAEEGARFITAVSPPSCTG